MQNIDPSALAAAKAKLDAAEAQREEVLLRHIANGVNIASRTVEIDEYLASDPNQVVVDYMASMTDSYFMALYAHLFPRSKKRIITRGYCSDLG